MKYLQIFLILVIVGLGMAGKDSAENDVSQPPPLKSCSDDSDCDDLEICEEIPDLGESMCIPGVEEAQQQNSNWYGRRFQRIRFNRRFQRRRYWRRYQRLIIWRKYHGKY
ncbi:uncharacterized protein LOC134232893 [Saccostrea cucullata]|uniref:uncharacterized protein LOC134232893 n=1 Tax=Saccostrea cuccullata TaxID=36930 RepID=UPI002ED45983